VQPTARWAQTLRRFGRYAVWALPVYAILTLLAGLHRDPPLSTDQSSLDYYLDNDRLSVEHLAYSAGAAFFGLLGLAATTALLAGVRGRRLAAGGLLCGLAGAAVLLTEIGNLVIRQEAAGHALLRGRLTHVALTAQVRGGTATLVVLLGAVALALAWVLVGLAVWRSRVMQRTDGVLLVISAPLLYLGGLVLHMMPILGSLLLLAAGMGLSWTAARLTPGGAAIA
jgi:Amt family ammonium transporter